MGTKILQSFGSLQHELEQAKNSLKGVDENIKRLIGRDPSDLPPRPGLKRLQNDDKVRPNIKNINRARNFPHENDEPQIKRRKSNISVFKRLSERPVHEMDVHHGVQKQIISKVIVTPKEVPSREEALEAQNKDEKFKARNRRMFGALLGTLQKFQQEETKLKPREDKRAQLEKKIEEHEIKEKEEIKKERQELFLNRKKKQIEIKIIELKMLRMKEYTTWENSHEPLGSFIMTKAEPCITYLPRRLNDATKELLNTSKAETEAMIEKKKQQVVQELEHIEERMKRNFDHKFGSKETKQNEEKNEVEDGDNEDDDHLEEELNGLSQEKEEKDSKDEENEVSPPMEEENMTNSENKEENVEANENVVEEGEEMEVDKTDEQENTSVEDQGGSQCTVEKESTANEAPDVV